MSPSGASVGIGFAIAINMVKRIVDQIAQYGDVQRGQLGVQIQPLTPEFARYFNTKVGLGVIISAVGADSTAKKAGLLAGDVVTAIDDVAIVKGPELPNRVGSLRVGMSSTLTVSRDGKELKIPFTIAKPQLERFAVEDRVPKLAGVVFAHSSAPVADDKAQALLVLAVGSETPAWEAGLRAGDVVGEVNRKRVKHDVDLVAAAGSGPILLTVNRNDSVFFVLVE